MLTPLVSTLPSALPPPTHTRIHSKIKMEAIDTDALPGSFEYDTMRRNMSTAPEMVLFHGTRYEKRARVCVREREAGWGRMD